MKRLSQQGQALTEFIVVTTFLLAPLFLIVPVLAIVISLKQDEKSNAGFFNNPINELKPDGLGRLVLRCSTGLTDLDLFLSSERGRSVAWPVTK